MSSASVTLLRSQHEVLSVSAGCLRGSRWLRCCSSQQHDAPESQRLPGLQPGNPLMTYLMQVWRGIPQSGGLGWVTYGAPRSREEAERLLFYAARIRPNYSHKLETVTQ